MDGAELARHMEEDHAGELALTFNGRAIREENLSAWAAYHRLIHHGSVSTHTHTDDEIVPRTEAEFFGMMKVWLVRAVNPGPGEQKIFGAFSTEQGAEDYCARSGGEEEVIELEVAPPQFAGASILETYWQELDDILDRLLGGTPAEDGKDSGRAEAMVYAIAVATNPYKPNVSEIRKEARRRYTTRASA